MPAAAGKLQHYKGERPILTCIRSTKKSPRRLGRRVDLKSGGYLIVDQTEALTTIDVNTGGYVGARNFDDTIFKTNLRPLRPLPASCACATWAASSSWTSSTWCATTTSRPCCPSSSSCARSRQDHVVRHLLATGPGGDDAQAHPRIAGPHAVRALRGVPGQGQREDGAQRVLRHPARNLARGPPVQPARVPRGGLARVVELFLDEESQHLAACRLIGKPISRRRKAPWGKSSTTLFCCSQRPGRVARDPGFTLLAGYLL